MIERYTNATSQGWVIRFPLFWTARHVWDVTVLRDRVHRNGNHLFNIQFCRHFR